MSPKTVTLPRLWRGYDARNQNYKNIHRIVQKSMRIIQLKLLNAVLKHKITKSNKETFNKKFNYFANITLSTIFGNFFALLNA